MFRLFKCFNFQQNRTSFSQMCTNQLSAAITICKQNTLHTNCIFMKRQAIVSAFVLMEKNCKHFDVRREQKDRQWGYNCIQNFRFSKNQFRFYYYFLLLKGQ